jgi:DNA-binding IclR family transcriptional regulator
VEKAISIIQYLNGQTSLEASLHTLSTELGMTKSHCHNIMKTLLAEGWVSYDEQRRVYALASRLLADVSGLVARQDSTSGLLHDQLVRLSAQINTTCVISRIDADGSFVVVDRADEGKGFSVSVAVGHRFAHDSTAQFRVRLAWSDPALFDALLAKWVPMQRTPTSVLSREQMEEEIRLTRERGFAISRAEYTPGVMTFAAPIFNAFDQISLILVAFGVIEDLQPRQESVIAELLETTRRINAFMGGRL